MILYHGSNVKIDVIDLRMSKKYKDFGRAFYLSTNEEQALEVAKTKVFIGGGSVVLNRFEFDENFLSLPELKVKCFDSYSQEWADFVFANRDERRDFHHPFDIVYGPIANDRIGLQIAKLRENDISFELFLEKIKYSKGPTFQYAFCTEKSINLLKMI